MFLDGGYFFGGDVYFQKVSVLLHYIIIFIYIMYILMYLIHILQYMLRYVLVLRSFSFRSVRVHVYVYVVYEDTNVYNYMAMTGITRRR